MALHVAALGAPVIQFLVHEPLLEKFREQKAFLKKIRRATGRHEKKKAMRLDGRRPEYKLDHLIRERYPSFVDALHELDDVRAPAHGTGSGDHFHHGNSILVREQNPIFGEVLAIAA